MTRKEAILYAIENEIKAQNFYKMMSEKCDNEAKQIFLNLIPMEKIHEEKLRSIFHDEFPGDKVEIKDNLKPKFKVKQTDLRDPKTIYELGIDNENAAEKLYKKLADETEDISVKEVFLKLAQEESNHAELLQTEIERLTNIIEWFDDSELNGLMEY